MPMPTKEAQREYQRVWIANRRSEWFAGKQCADCGSTTQLELDHVDPAQKVSHRIWSWSQDRIAEETSKCQVLCQECHNRKTMAFDRKQATHGTDNMYSRHGCRCDDCREARSIAKRDNRLRRKSLGLPRQ